MVRSWGVVGALVFLLISTAIVRAINRTQGLLAGTIATGIVAGCMLTMALLLWLLRESDPKDEKQDDEENGPQGVG